MRAAFLLFVVFALCAALSSAHRSLRHGHSLRAPAGPAALHLDIKLSEEDFDDALDAADAKADECPITVLDAAKSTFTISSSSIEPCPPHKNENVTIHAAGTLATAFSDASAAVTVYWDSIKVISKNIDVCSAGVIKCPVAAGKMDLSAQLVLPSIAPAGSYRIDVVITDDQQNEVSSVEASFSLQ